MMIMHSVFSTPIHFDENQINILVVEHPKALTDMLLTLLKQSEGDDGSFVLSENYTPLDFAKEAEIVISPFEIDINQRKILTKLHQKLTSLAIGEENFLKTKELMRCHSEYLGELLQQADYHLSFCDEFDVANLFKLADIRINTDSRNLIESLTDYLTIYAELCKTSCFIFVNLKSYLSDEELLDLYQFIQYKKLNILLIESIYRKQISPIEKIRVIDADMCEIY